MTRRLHRGERFLSAIEPLASRFCAFQMPEQKMECLEGPPYPLQSHRRQCRCLTAGHRFAPSLRLCSHLCRAALWLLNNVARPGDDVHLLAIAPPPSYAMQPAPIASAGAVSGILPLASRIHGPVAGFPRHSCSPTWQA